MVAIFKSKMADTFYQFQLFYANMLYYEFVCDVYMITQLHA